MKVTVTNKDLNKNDLHIEDVSYVTIILGDGSKYDIDFKFQELYIRKTGSRLTDEIKILPKASNVISLK